MANEWFGLVLRSDLTSTTEVAVMMVLADAADADGVCWPSVDFLVTATRAGRSTVLRTLAGLEAGGFLTRKRRRAQSTVFTLNRDRLIRKSHSGTSRSETSQSGTSHSETPEVPQRDGSKENPHRTPTVAHRRAQRSHRKGKDGYTADFETWWTAYPRKVDKYKASQAFRKALKHTTAEALTAGVRGYAAEVAGRDQEHIKYATTWLNGRCWENSIPTANASGPDTIDTATEWLRGEWKAGRTSAIEKRAAIRYHRPDIPLDVHRDQVADFYRDHARRWIDEHRDQILTALTQGTAP